MLDEIINDYTYLVIIIGGQCIQPVKTDCLEFRKLPSLINKGKIGKKTLILIFDQFKIIGQVRDNTVEEYNDQLFSENTNIDILHLKIGLSNNHECFFNKNLNNFIDHIVKKKGFVIIINSASSLSNVESHYRILRSHPNNMMNIFSKTIFNNPRILIYYEPTFRLGLGHIPTIVTPETAEHIILNNLPEYLFFLTLEKDYSDYIKNLYHFFNLIKVPFPEQIIIRPEDNDSSSAATPTISNIKIIEKIKKDKFLPSKLLDKILNDKLT